MKGDTHQIGNLNIQAKEEEQSWIWNRAESKPIKGKPDKATPRHWLGDAARSQHSM